MECNMSRKCHTLMPTGKLPYPQSVVAVQARVEQHYLGEADDVGHLAISEWYSCYGTVVGTAIEWGDEGNGTTQDQWWRWLQEHTAGHMECTIYSWQARECMAALGLWDRLADSAFTLSRADPMDTGGNGCTKPGDTSGYIVLEGPPTIVAFAKKHSGTRYLWIDPANYGIRDIGTYADPVDVVSEGDTPMTGELWIKGARIQSIAYAVCEWLQAYYRAVSQLELGGPANTAASQAMQAFRHHYMRHRISIHDSQYAIDLERQALYGGRCEANYIGYLYAGESRLSGPQPDDKVQACRESQGPLYVLDVNSMYPSVAEHASLPVALKGVCGPTDVYTLLSACRVTGVIAVVDVKTDVPCVPIRLDDRIVYPVGRFATVLCGPEILLASQCGARLKCKRLAVYETVPIYQYMVERLWTARTVYRDSGDKRMECVVKSILNAAFGKWAQTRKKWEDVKGVLPLRPYMQWWQVGESGTEEQYRAIGWNVQRMVTLKDEPNETFPAIAAYIHSLARVKLWRLLEICGHSNVYYMDTDSIMTNQYGFEALFNAGQIGPKELGKLKIVSQPSVIRIIGRQAYELDGVLTISGARGEVRKAGDAYVEVLTAPPISYYLLHSDPPGLERRIARVRTTRGYRLGNVAADGAVTPIRFEPPGYV